MGQTPDLGIFAAEAMPDRKVFKYFQRTETGPVAGARIPTSALCDQTRRAGRGWRQRVESLPLLVPSPSPPYGSSRSRTGTMSEPMQLDVPAASVSAHTGQAAERATPGPAAPDASPGAAPTTQAAPGTCPHFLRRSLANPSIHSFGAPRTAQRN